MRRSIRHAICLALFVGGLSTHATELLGPAAINLPTGTSPVDVKLADLNEDGILDIVVANLASDTVVVGIGDGVGSFDIVDTIPFECDAEPDGCQPRTVEIGDFDGNGRADIVVAERNTNRITVLVAAATDEGRYEPRYTTRVGIEPISMVALDLDVDRRSDLVVVNSIDNDLSVFRGTSTAQLQYLGDVELCGGNPVAKGNLRDGAVTAVAATLDDDGFPDLAVLSRKDPDGTAGANCLTLLHGDGAGGFLSVESIGLPDEMRPSHLAAGEFDRDGLTDLVVADSSDNGGSGSLLVLLSQGDGVFEQVALAFGGDIAHRPSHVLVTDLDDDGNQDLVSSSLLSGNLVVQLGNGDGSFSITSDGDSSITNIDSTADPVKQPAATVAGDFDLDGALDLAIADPGVNAVTLFRGNGTGEFVSTPFASFGTVPKSVAVGLFDSDAIPDIAISNSGEGTLSVLKGTAFGEFFAVGEYALPIGDAPSPTMPDEWNIVSDDWNGDCILDLATVNTSARSISLFLGQGEGCGGGNGQFEEVEPLIVGSVSIPNRIVSGNFDGDEFRDIAVAGRGPRGVTVYLGNVTAEPVESINVFSGDFAINSIVAGDFDGDQRDDLAYTYPGGMRILRSQGNGEFALQAQFDFPFPGLDVVATAHLDEDDALDLVASGTGDNVRVVVFSGDGNGGFSIAQDFELPGQGIAESIGVGDFNDDGAMDLAIAFSSTGSVQLLMGQRGALQFERSQDLAVGRDPFALAVADFDDDELIDLVVPVSQRNGFVTLLNQVESRADVNGSNRVDGLDLNLLARSNGCQRNDDCYASALDISLDGTIDGDDLGVLAQRFGEAVSTPSLLRPRLAGTAVENPQDAVYFSQDETATVGDVLALNVMVNSGGKAVVGAEFAVTFDPRVLGYESKEPGTLLGGPAVFSVKTNGAGRIEASVVRLGGEIDADAGAATLVQLRFRARQTTGAKAAPIDFDGFESDDMPVLLNDAGVVPDIDFISASVAIDGRGGGPAGQRIAVFPSSFEFGDVSSAETLTSNLRIRNVGSSPLTVRRIRFCLRGDPCEDGDRSVQIQPEVTSGISIAAGGLAVFRIVFSPTGVNLDKSFVLVESDDPNRRRRNLKVPVRGSAFSALTKSGER